MMEREFILKHAAQLSRILARASKYGADLDLCQCLVCVSSKGSGKTSVCVVTGGFYGNMYWPIITNQYLLVLRVCGHVCSANILKHADMVNFDMSIH